MTQMIELEFPDDKTAVDLLLWQTFKRETPRLVEKTLDMNPGLAAKGIFPPKGTRIRVEVPDGFVSDGAGGWRYMAPPRASVPAANAFDFGAELASMNAEKAKAGRARAAVDDVGAQALQALVRAFDAFRANHNLQISSAITASNQVTLDKGENRRFVITREPSGLFSIERRGQGLARLVVDQVAQVDLDEKTLMREIIAWAGVQA